MVSFVFSGNLHLPRRKEPAQVCRYLADEQGFVSLVGVHTGQSPGILGLWGLLEGREHLEKNMAGNLKGAERRCGMQNFGGKC